MRSNPRTMVAELLQNDPAARAFLISRTDELRAAVRLSESRKRPASDDEAELHFSLGLHVEAIGGDLEEALRNVHRAIQVSCGAPDQWHAEALRLNRLVDAKRVQAAVLEKNSPPLFMRPPSDVPRVDPETFSCAEFVAKHALPGIPVVITGGASIVTCGSASTSSSPANDSGDRCWESLHNLGVALSGFKGPLKVRDPRSTNWARLEEAEVSADLGAFVARVASGAEASGELSDDEAALVGGISSGSGGNNGSGGGEREPRYLHDWSLPLNAPALAEGLTIPRWFAGDFFPRLDENGERFVKVMYTIFVGLSLIFACSNMECCNRFLSGDD